MTKAWPKGGFAITTPDGWMVRDLEDFKFLVKQSPPRSGVHLRQLKADMRSFRVLGMWIAGLVLVLLGITFRDPIEVFWGGMLIGVWALLFHAATRNSASAPVKEGLVRALGKHPLSGVGRHISIGDAELPGGETVPVMLPTQPASDIIATQGAVRVILLFAPKSQFSPVLGVKEPYNEGTGRHVMEQPEAETVISGDAGRLAVGFHMVKLRFGASWFYWIAGLSVLNSLAALFQNESSFFIGLGITQLFDGIAAAMADGLTDQAAMTIKVAALVLGVLVALVFVLLGWLANRKHGWAFVAGMALYVLDALVLLWAEDWLSMGFHAFALFCILPGYSALRKVREAEVLAGTTPTGAG